MLKLVMVGYHFNSGLPLPFVGMHVYGTGVFSIASLCTLKVLPTPLFVVLSYILTCSSRECSSWLCKLLAMNVVLDNLLFCVMLFWDNFFD